ncbi:hypothetical protein QUC31_004193 [Theobroma cacao]|uniref:Period circadian protein, putative isoform 1 n=1 Tax=Theobroma cacao TaxID=3641 RepID=A0A061DNC6_THECC|nr:Period circadian protein, putative isoform 1 [Theobroma cacao]
MDLEENLESLSLQNSDQSQSRELWRMKVASNVFFIYDDEDGFANAIAQGLCPTPYPYNKVFELLHLGLREYDHKYLNLTGSVAQLRDEDNAKATMVMLHHLEPPILSHAINAVLAKIADAKRISSTVPSIVAPFLVPASKLKLEGGNLTTNSNKLPLYGIQVGPETDASRVIAAKTQKPPLSLQIHYEPLACFLQIVRAANLPTSIIVGQRSQSPFNEALIEDQETLYEIGELMASTTGTYFRREQMKTNWIPTAKSGSGGREPWRAFYG